MTTYRIPAPDGKTYRIDGPAGASQEEIKAEVIRQHPHLGKTPAPAAKFASNEVPNDRMPLTPAPPAPSLYQRLLGVAEVPLGMLGGAVSGVVGPLAHIYGNVTSGSFGQPEGVRAGERSQARAEQAVGYKPVTQPGAENIQAVGEALAPLIGVPIPTMNALARGLKAPAQLASNALIGEAQLAGGAVASKVKARSAATQAANVAKSYANAPLIEAAQIAQRRGLALPPSISNPSKTTRAMSAIAGREGDAKLGESNVKQIIKLVKDELGDTSPEPTISLATIDNALDIASAPYEPVRALPVLRVSDALAQKINAIPKAPSIGGEAGAAAVSSLVDEALLKLSKGRSGDAVLGDIKQLRTDAQAIFKANDKGTSAPNPTATAKANAAMKIADTLEAIIDANAAAEVVPALRAARTKMAQIYDHARAIDYVTGVIDPQMYAKLLRERKGQMTGLPADIGKVAAIYPTVMTPTAATSFTAPRLVRGGLGATAGAVFGSPLGPFGAAGGLVAGSAAGAFAGNLAARRMASPAFQAKYAVPRDYRPNALAPEPPINTLPVPYTSQEQMAPGQLVTRPNWDYYRPALPSGVQVGVPPRAPQLAAPSSEATMANVAQQRAYELARDRAAAAQATQAAEAESVATRKPAGRGVVLEKDPNTGGFRVVEPASTTLEPTSLQSAVAKLSGVPTTETQTTFRRTYAGTPLKDAQGANIYEQRPVAKTVTPGANTSQAPTLTATEKIAWDRARVTLDTVLPGFTKLSDTQVFSKLLDRQWVTEAVKKSREKANMWAEKAQQEAITDQQIAAATDAANRRTALMDVAEALEARLRAPRSVAKSSQGPKTRAAQRLNQLAPEDAVIVTPQNSSLR
jgi:hypothetical protein